MNEPERNAVGFGRRGQNNLAGVQTGVQTGAQTGRDMPAPRRAAPVASEDPVTPQWLAALILVFLLGVIWLESLFADTALITPLSDTFLWTMRGLGLVAGAVFAILGIAPMSINLLRKILAILFTPLLGAALFDGIGWRMADWWEFTASSAAWESADYPVQSVHHGRKLARDSIEIDPFATHETTDIPIPAEQYQLLRSSDAQWCVTVMQRRSSSGAIEIRTDGTYTMKTPQRAAIRECPGAVPSDPA